MHLWHDITLPERFPDELTAVIEIPKQSSVKYELDKTTGHIMVDRIMYGSMVYPLNYGFIPRTYCDDNDPLDILIIGDYPLLPGCLLRAYPIGYIHMLDDSERDSKIIAIPSNDPEHAHIKDLNDLSPHLILKIENFFATYKTLQNKHVSEIASHPRKEAIAILQQACEDYKKQDFS